MTRRPPRPPDWDSLYETASAQEGLFTTKQAREAGYSPQLLVHHVHAGNITRLLRGIYRLVHFPAGEHEDLVAAWLWTDRAGVISHQSALALHGLSDVLPANIHITLPSAWKHRRFRVPTGMVLHHAEVPARDKAWIGAVPLTLPGRTLNDCALAGLSPEHLRKAACQALKRGWVERRELADVRRVLAPFGGFRG